MRLLVALGICGLLLFAFSFLVVTLGEWCGSVAFFRSPVWVKLRIPAIVGGVLGCLLLVFAYLSHSNRAQLQAYAQYAESQGWGFSREDAPGLKAQAEALFYDMQFDVRSVRTVETGARRLYLFDCTYHLRVGKPPGHQGTACLILSDAFDRVRSPVLLCERIWTDALLLSEQVDMGDSPFARAFIVQSKDPLGAKEALNGSLQGILLELLNSADYRPAQIAIGPGGAVLLTGLTTEHGRWHDLINLARRIDAAVQ